MPAGVSDPATSSGPSAEVADRAAFESGGGENVAGIGLRVTQDGSHWFGTRLGRTKISKILQGLGAQPGRTVTFAATPARRLEYPGG